MKVCTKCYNNKILSDFPKDKSKKDGLSPRCKTCALICSKNYYENNEEKIKNYHKIYGFNNKEKISKRFKKYVEKLEVKKKKKIHNKEYGSLDRVKVKRNQRNQKKYKFDIQYRLRCIYRTRIYQAFKFQNLKKPKGTIKLLDMSQTDYQIYLESQFLPPFEWTNIGVVWEIDHIKPISNFDLTDPEQVKECFHYLNTRPIFKTNEIAESYGYSDQTGNRNKSNKII